MQDVVSEAIKRVQSVMLRRVAEKSGLLNCVEGHPWRVRRSLDSGDGMVEELGVVDSHDHRRLKRGANSIVGLSSEPMDEADTNGEFLHFLSLCFMYGKVIPSPERNASA